MLHHVAVPVSLLFAGSTISQSSLRVFLSSTVVTETTLIPNPGNSIITNFRISLWLIIDVNYVPRFLYRVDVDDIADVS